MSENVGTGCSIWVAATAIIFGFLAMFTGESTLGYSTPTPIPTLAASISSAVPSIPLVLTVTPQETDAYFILANNQIIYTYTPTLGKPCYYVIAGRVFDLRGEPYTNFVVNIKMLDEIAPEGPAYAFPGEGGYAQDGPSRWIVMLPQSPVEYEIWLTTEVGGDELSAHIILPPKDCDHNMAIVDFVQVKTFP